MNERRKYIWAGVLLACFVFNTIRVLIEGSFLYVVLAVMQLIGFIDLAWGE